MSNSALHLQPAEKTLVAAVAERMLLLLVGVFLFLNTLALVFRSNSLDRLIPFAAWVVSAAVGSWWLSRRMTWRDPLLFPAAMFLSGWGLLIIERLTPIFGERQTVWLIVGTAALCAVAAIPDLLRQLRAFRYTLLFAGLALLLATIVLGTNPTGDRTAPQLWLGFGGLFFQPAELLKIMLVIFLASYLAEQYPMLRALHTRSSRRIAGFSPRIVGPILFMWGLSVLILIWQRDLGTAALFFIVFLLLLYLSSGLIWLLVGGLILIAAAGFIAYQLFDVVQLRVDIWLNPWPESNTRAFQIVQSLFAFAEGGVLGRGIGGGSPGYIPVVHSDFVFAALAEEWGLLGTITLLITIALIVMRGLRMAVRLSRYPYFSLLAAGLSLLIGVQTILIAGGVLKLIPLTGVTLPFVSYGGSSLVNHFISIGLLLRLSAEDSDRGT